MSKRALEPSDPRDEVKIQKVVTVGDVKGIVNFGEVIGSSQSTTINHYACNHQDQPLQQITGEFIENKIFEDIMRLQDKDLFHQSIINHGLSAERIIKIFRLLRLRSDKDFLFQVISSTVAKWNILNIIKESSQIKELLDFFTEDLENFSQVLFDEENQNGDNLMHILSKMGDLTVLQHFLETSCKNVKDDLLEVFMQFTSKDGNNFLHVICSDPIQHPDILQEVILIVEKKLSIDAISKMVTATNNCGEDVFNIMSRFQKPEVFSEMWNWLVEDYFETAREIAEARNIDGQNIPQTIFVYNSKARKSILPVIRTLNDKFGEGPLLEDLVTGQNKVNNNLCHMAFRGNQKLFLDILQMKELDKNLIEKIFFHPGANNEKIMDKLCTNLMHFKSSVSTVHNEHGFDITRSILYNGDEKGNPVLLKIINKNDISVTIQFLNWVLEEYKEKFTFEWIRKRNVIENLSYYYIQTVLKYKALIVWVVDNININFVENIADRSVNNWIFLHYYSYVNDEISFLKFLRLVFDKYDLSLVQELLLHKEKEGHTFMHLLCESNDKVSIIELLELLFSKLDQKFVGKLSLCKGSQNWTFLHILCRNNEKISFKELLELLFLKLDRDIVVELLLSKTEENRTFLHILCRNNDNIPFKEFLELLLSKLDRDVVAELLISKQREGYTFLQVLCQSNDKISYKELLELLLFDKLDQYAVAELLLHRQKNNSTFLHLLSRYNQNTPFVELLEFLLDKFDRKVIGQLLLAKDSGDWTFLQILCRSNDKTSIIDMLELLFLKLDRDIVKELLFYINVDGLTFLHILSCFDDKTPLKDLLELLLGKFDRNIVEKLLLSKQKNGWTFLHAASQYNKKICVFDILKTLFVLFDDSFVLNLLMMVKEKNETIFTILNKESNADTIIDLLEFLATKFESSDLKSILNIKNDENRTFISQVETFENEQLLNNVVAFISGLG